MPDATQSQHLDWFSFTDLLKIQTLTLLKSQKTEVFRLPVEENGNASRERGVEKHAGEGSSEQRLL